MRFGIVADDSKDQSMKLNRKAKSSNIETPSPKPQSPKP